MKKNRNNLQILLIALLLLFAAVFSACGGDDGDGGPYAAGVEALEAGDLEGAMQQFKTAVDQDSRKAEAYRGEGIVYMKQENYASAATMFERSLVAWKRSESSDVGFREDVQYYLAEAYARGGQPMEALELYTDLTSGNTPDRAYLMRGCVYIQEGDVKQAMADFDSVIKISPNYENCIRIFEALSDASHKADGATYLERALEFPATTAENYYDQGRVYYYLGNYDQARDSFSQSADMGHMDAITMLGRVSIENGDTDAARAAYKKVIAGGENQATAYNGLALCDIADGAYEDALSNIQKGIAALDAEPEEEEDQGGEAVNPEEDEQTREALRFNEIVAYEKLLDFEKALQLMEAFIADYPENAAAQREYKFLQSR